MRSLIVIGSGKFSALMPQANDQPRIEFVEIARALRADIHSADAPIGLMSRIIPLSRSRPAVASAMGAAWCAGNYDAIYTTGEDIGIWLAAFLRLRRWKGRLVCVVHSLTPKKTRLFRLLGTRTFAKLITVSRSQAALLSSECGFPKNRVASVFNWIDDRFFDPMAKVGSATAFMACGAENRDYRTLREAFTHLADATLRIFGSGFRHQSVQQSVNRSASTIEMPRVSYDELRTAYASAKCIVVPLHAGAYAAGVTGLLEGMASGRPVVVTRTVGIADYLEVIPQSLQVEPGDPMSIVNAINSLPADAAGLSELGLRNRHWVQEHCSLDMYVRYVCSVMTGAEDHASPILS